MNLQKLFAIFAKEMANNKGLVSMTKTAVQHTVKAFGVSSACQIPTSAFGRLIETLVTYLKAQGSSKYKLRNNKSCISCLLRWGREKGYVPSDEPAEISKEWWEAITTCRCYFGKQGALGWQALARWASSKGLQPSDLTSNDLLEFARWLQTESGYKSWRIMYRYLKGTCRRASLEGKLPPLTFPSLPHKSPAYRLPLTEWPSQTQRDYQGYRNWATAELMPGRPRKNKQRDISARITLRTLERIAGYFVNICGNPRKDLNFLTFLDKDMITSFASWLSSEREVSKMTILRYVQPLTAIGLGYLRFERKDVPWLGELVEQLRGAKPRDKSEKLVSHEQLLSVPERLRQERIVLKQEIRRRRKKLNKKRLALMEKRLAWMHSKECIIRFTIVTVLRTRNILEATLGKNLKRASDGTWRIHFEGIETKTGNVLTFNLPPFLGFYLDEYLKDARPILAANGDSNRLFLTSVGSPLYESALRRIMKSVCLRYLGKPISPHLIRTIVGTGLWKKGVPIEDIAMILGHKNVNTTWRTYVHCEMDESMKKHHALLEHAFDSSGDPAKEDMQRQRETKHPEKMTHEVPESTLLDRQVDKKEHGFPVDGRASEPSGQAKRADRACQSPVQKPSQNRQPPKAGNIPLRAKHRTRKIPKKTLDGNQSDVSGQLSLFRCESLDENSKDGHTC